MLLGWIRRWKSRRFLKRLEEKWTPKERHCTEDYRRTDCWEHGCNGYSGCFLRNKH
jgi:hypothetical protein